MQNKVNSLKFKTIVAILVFGFGVQSMAQSMSQPNQQATEFHATMESIQNELTQLAQLQQQSGDPEIRRAYNFYAQQLQEVSISNDLAEAQKINLQLAHELRLQEDAQLKNQIDGLRVNENL